MRPLVLAIAILCCSFISSANIPAVAQQVQQSVKQDSFRRAMNATARVRMYENGKLAWMGSAVVIGKDSKKLTLLSNSHVFAYKGDPGRVTAEFCVNGTSLGEYEVDVLHSYRDELQTLDIAFGSVPNLDVLADVPFMPLAVAPAKVGDRMFQCGCDAGHWTNGSLGKIYSVESSTSNFRFTPPAWPGDSGSGVYTEDGRALIGLTAWRFYDPALNGYVGGAMDVDAIRREMLKVGSQKEPPKVQPQPQQPPRRRVFPRFRRIGEEPSEDTLDWAPIRDFINARVEKLQERFQQIQDRAEERQAKSDQRNYEAALEIIEQNKAIIELNQCLVEQVQHAITEAEQIQEENDSLQKQLDELEQSSQAQQAGLLDALRRRRMERQAEWSEFLNRREIELSEDRSALQAIQSRFAGVMGKLRLVVWCLSILAALVVATLFFGPGWVALVMFKILTTIIKVFMAGYHVIKNAVTTPVVTKSDAEFDSFQERFDELQKQVGESVK